MKATQEELEKAPASDHSSVSIDRGLWWPGCRTGDAPERKQRKTVAPSRKTTVGHFSSLTVAGSLQKCPAGTRISHSRESTSPRFTSNRAVSRGTGPQEGRSAFAPVSTLLPLALALDEGVRPRTPDAEVVPGTSIQAVAKAAEQSIVAEAAEQPVRPPTADQEIATT